MFEDQLSTNAFLVDLLYWVGTAATLLAVVGLLMVDLGVVRQRYALDTVVKRLSGALVAAGSFMLIGNAIWIIQFNQAYGVPNPIGTAIRQWWIGGVWMRTVAGEIDPKQLANADLEQIFVAFFAAFAALVVVLILSGGLERLKASATYVIAVVAGGFVLPVLLYLTWGPLSPLTVRGVHDFLGVFPGYILAGSWALILAWRLGPRYLREDEDSPHGHNYPIVALGVGILVTSVPLFAVACGFLIPGVGYFGINMSTSGFGIVVLNCLAGTVGGAIAGTVIGHRLHSAYWVLIGPVAGYISVGAMMDISQPWISAFVGAAGAFIALGVDNILYAINIDEHKVVPLGLGCGSFSVLIAGIVGWGEGVGGFVGLEGEYGFQGAEMNLGWQLLGLAITLAIALGTALVVIVGLEKTIGIRISAYDDEHGPDATVWMIDEPRATGAKPTLRATDTST